MSITYFRAVGIFQIVRQTVPKIAAPVAMPKIIQDGTMPARVVPIQEEMTEMALVTVGRLLICTTEYPSALELLVAQLLGEEG
jgi:hypothetical protein